jgi:copper chaperone NosL
MTVQASDDWASEIYYKDGTKLMFESPTDMFAYYLSPEAFNTDAVHRDPANIERITVKDYQTKQAIDARQATLVVKSKVEGPMGPELLPFAKREDAEAFASVNGGTLLAFNGIMNDTIRDLRN